MRAKILLLPIILMTTLPAIAEEGVADARRHMVRGMAAIEMAKSDAELAPAADEFRLATNLDPSLSAAWYNLGSVQAKLGQFDLAIQSYRHYLALVPQAADAQNVADEITKLEFRQEQAAKSKRREGAWIAADGTYYILKGDGSRITLVTREHRISDNEAESTNSTVGGGAILEKEQVSYSLKTSGSQLSGTWMHTAVKAEACTIPEETGDVTGEFRDADGLIVLRYARTKFRAEWNENWLSGDVSCGSVTPVEKREVEIVLRGPVPHGIVSINLKGLYAYVEQGIFGKLKIGWAGDLHAGEIDKDSAVYAAGLRSDDAILSIDGAEVKKLTAGDVLWRLWGEVGSEVEMTVVHKGSNEPVSLSLKRTQVY